MGITAGVLHEKFDVNSMKHRVFERFDLFSTKYGHDGGMFVRERTFFSKYGHESDDFFVKIGHQWHPIDHFGS